MKKCTKCNELRSLSEFSLRRDRPTGLNYWCKLCSKNSIRVRKRYLEYEKIRSQKRRGKRNEYFQEYKKKNCWKYSFLAAKRKSDKLLRTPKWLSNEHIKEIQQFYIDAAYLTHYTKTKFEIDHILPLCGEKISGLHVPWNLQILTRSENLAKGKS